MVVKAKSVYSTLIMIFIDHVGFVKWVFLVPMLSKATLVKWDGIIPHVKFKGKYCKVAIIAVQRKLTKFVRNASFNKKL